MAKKQNKYTYDSRLFSAEPPEENTLLEKLFCGRKHSLERATKTLKSNMDIKGKRKGKKPWIVVGQSRSGKSHLARHVFGLLKKKRNKQTFYNVIIPARERLDAREVVRFLFEQLREIYREKEPSLLENIPKEDEGDVTQAISLMSQIIQRITDFFEQKVDSLEVTLTEAYTRTSQVQGTLSFPFLSRLLKLIGGTSWSTQDTDGKKLVFRQPSTADIIDWCAQIVELLVELKRLDHLLVLVDDVDLLEGYQNAEKNGAIQRNRLTEALVRFHQTPHVDVLLTARSWYGQTHKELEILVDLESVNDFDETDLKAMYEKHFAVFGKKNLPKRFLQDDALGSIAANVGNLPGVFLRLIKTAFDHYKGEPEWEDRDLAWFQQVYRTRFSNLKKTVPKAAQAIEDALQNGRLSIDVRENNPFLHTTAIDEFVYQSYFDEASYFMPSFLWSVVPSTQTSTIEKG